MRRFLMLMVLLATAGCAADGQSAWVTPARVPAATYQRAQDAQLPIDQQVAALQSAETGCANETAVTETAPLPPIPGDPSSAVHRDIALQGSPANTVVGDAAFDTCMHSLGYDRIR